MYKVFIENKPVIISSAANEISGSILRSDSPSEVWAYIQEMVIKDVAEIFVVCSSPKEVWEAVFKRHKKVKAAGGVVYSDRSFLLIQRLGYWDLPKGKLEKQESSEKAAIREVHEECGIEGHAVLCFLDQTFHTYEMNEKNFLKTTDWYFMRYDGNDPLIAQREEQITEVRWVNTEELAGFRKQMYPSLHGVLDLAVELVKSGTVFV